MNKRRTGSAGEQNPAYRTTDPTLLPQKNHNLNRNPNRYRRSLSGDGFLKR